MVQPTQLQERQVISEDGAVLLGLDGFALVRVQLEPDGARVVHVVTADDSARSVPDLWGHLNRSEELGHHPPPRRALRPGPGPAGLAQKPLAMP